MCHGWEFELLMAKTREAERRRQEKSKAEAARQPVATPAAPVPEPTRNEEPVPV